MKSINKYLIKFINLSDANKQKFLNRFEYLPKKIQNVIIDYYIQKKENELQKVQRPSDLLFFITSYCNMRCEHCFYKDELDRKDNKDELSIEELKKFAVSFNGKVRGISLTGGEPFIRKDLTEAVDAFHKIGGVKQITIATNGFYVDRMEKFVAYVAKELPNLELHLQISLDGLEETHDKVRKIKNSFKRAVDCLSKMEAIAEKYPKINVIINSVVHKYNIDEFPEFYNYFKTHHKANFIWHFARQDENDVKAIDKKKLMAYTDEESFAEASKDHILPSMEECEDLIDKMDDYEGANALTRWRKLEKRHHLKIAHEGKRAVKQCTAPKKGAVVYGNGEMAVCEILKPVTNIREHNYSFFDAWESDSMAKLRKEASNCYCTYPCYLLDSMLYDKNSIKEALNLQ